MRISDWSSDVCSSDLPVRQAIHCAPIPMTPIRAILTSRESIANIASSLWRERENVSQKKKPPAPLAASGRPCLSPSMRDQNLPRSVTPQVRGSRSEERRDGKECVRTRRYRWSPHHLNKNKPNHTQKIKNE